MLARARRGPATFLSCAIVFSVCSLLPSGTGPSGTGLRLAAAATSSPTSSTSTACAVTGSCSIFTEAEIKQLASKRVRKEIRNISAAEWDAIVDAMWIMKNTSDAHGTAKYGSHFVSYDRLVAQHMNAAMDQSGDQGHYVPVFFVFHRLFMLKFERSLMAINSSISALPYWDMRLDADDLSGSVIFSDKYFGNVTGDSSDGYVVKNGRFAYWPINSNVSSVSAKHKSVFGYLRNPISLNDKPYLTRRGPYSCGSSVSITISTYWDTCLDVSDITEWFSCIDLTIHASGHRGVGGSYPIPGLTDYKSSSCLQWYSCSGAGAGSGLQYHPSALGCFSCPSCKVGVDTSSECVCSVTKASCGPCWSGSSTAYLTLGNASYLYIKGDMTDPITSPNDPIFMFHHANVDRHAYLWMASNYDLKPYYDFKTSGFGNGGNLYDVVAANDSFTNLFTGAAGPYTVAQTLDLTDILVANYTYDTVISVTSVSTSTGTPSLAPTLKPTPRSSHSPTPIPSLTPTVKPTPAPGGPPGGPPLGSSEQRASDGSSTMSSAMIAVIVVCTTIGVGMIGGAAAFFFRRSRRFPLSAAEVTAETQHHHDAL